MHRLLFVPLAALVLLVVPQARAQAPPTGDDLESLRAEVQQLRQVRDQYEARLQALEARLDALQAPPGAAAPPPLPPPGPTAPPTTAAVPAGAAGAGGPTGALPVYGGAAAASKIFNPDIAVIGDFIGVAGKSPGSGEPSLDMQESEVGFQAVVDPYARADFFFTFGPEEVGVEEAYLTFPTLPVGLLGKVGKMRDAFGKVNGMHAHVLPWVDRPLLTRNLLGGEDGLADSGLSLSRLIPNPWLFLEATGQVYRGDNAVFKASTRGELTYLGHLRGYQDLTESTNLDLGGSVAYGHNDTGLTTRLLGADATIRWRPLRRAIYHQLVARTELAWSRREEPGGAQDSFGTYVSLDYQFGRRWFAGVRYDYSERATDATLVDEGGSLLLTYWPSEFSQIRGQLRRTHFGEGQTANEFLFQFLFSIGAHGAHAFQ
jgi:hypothetical protein